MLKDLEKSPDNVEIVLTEPDINHLKEDKELGKCLNEGNELIIKYEEKI